METVKLWGILHGPFHRDETEHDPPEGCVYMAVLKAEVKGKVFEEEFWFGTLEEFRVLEKHFQTKIEPIELRY